MELELEGVSKAFLGRVSALKDVSLRVAAGETLVLVGPSGCGKTTLLRILAGLETPDVGKIRFAGEVANDVPPWRRPVAMVFQRPAFVAGRSVRRTLQAGSPTRSITTELAETCRRVGIDDLFDRPVEKLSGGQVQRLALAKLLARHASVNLLDEPLGPLDAPLRAKVRQTLRDDFERRRATVVWVTHDPDDAMALADRVAVLEQGQLRQWATPAEIVSRPAHRVVAELFQEQQGGLNFLEGTIREGRLETSLGSWTLPAGFRFRDPADCGRGVKNAGISVALPVKAVRVSYNGLNSETRSCVMVANRHRAFPQGDRLLCRNEHGELWAQAEEKVSVGQTVTLMLDLEQALWFDAESGKAMVAA